MATDPHSAQRRRRLVVRPNYQWKVIGLILGLFVVFALLILLLLRAAFAYTLSWLVLQDEAVLRAMYRVVLEAVALGLLLCTPLVLLLGLRTTHRMVGPIQRIVRALDGMTAGHYAVRLTFRKRDILKDVAEAVNRLAASLSTRAR